MAWAYFDVLRLVEDEQPAPQNSNQDTPKSSGV